ncbi:MAG: L-rhamnose isomerase [Planctomycetota bacterium]|nr:MAG: L-rhamnose isomerase [Planctomycetota bacterium]
MDTKTLSQYLDRQVVETPSWGYANSGTRFGTFVQDAAARSLEEKIDDAAQVQAFTGITPAIALHIPWDDSDDWPAVARYAGDRGIRIGAINPNVFQDQCYKFGSFGHPDPAVRQRAIDNHLRCIEVAAATGSRDLSLWFADGTNYPGQDCFRSRRQRFRQCFETVYAALQPQMRLLIEYKFFEPAFYHTDLCDWGQVALLCRHLGPQATVLVDTGHHAQGTNLEHIVATLLDEGLLGGFHFNGRKYADDDLTVGSINPYELFLIYNELVDAELSDDAALSAHARQVAYMFDQSHNLKGKIEATIQSAITVQESYAKALLVDRVALRAARAAMDIVGAEEVLKDAWHSDVRPLLRDWRSAKGLDPDPLAAFRRSGYEQRVAAERLARHGRAASGGGYQ